MASRDKFANANLLAIKKGGMQVLKIFYLVVYFTIEEDLNLARDGLSSKEERRGVSNGKDMLIKADRQKP